MIHPLQRTYGPLRENEIKKTTIYVFYRFWCCSDHDCFFVSNENTPKNDEKELYLVVPHTCARCLLFPPLFDDLVFNLLVSVGYGTVHTAEYTLIFNQCDSIQLSPHISLRLLYY
jgi:hypothetical protein